MDGAIMHGMAENTFDPGGRHDGDRSDRDTFDHGGYAFDHGGCAYDSGFYTFDPGGQEGDRESSFTFDPGGRNEDGGVPHRADQRNDGIG